MTTDRLPTRQRIVNTALELFSRQGITETTTRQIADHASINEVTLFRHFGNKHGLLLAVLQEFLQEYLVVTQVGDLMKSDFYNERDLAQFLRQYIQSSLQALESVPELMRSLVGEAGQYPMASRQALAQGIIKINQAIAAALSDLTNHSQIHLPLAPLQMASIVNACILGYTVMVLTSEAELIWQSREDFVGSLLEVLVSEVKFVSKEAAVSNKIVDIPSETVRGILLQAKRMGLRDYAIAYVLFGAGLSAQELINLQQEDYSITGKAGVLRIDSRFVPLNQKIFEHRYGSANNNPLTNYLKNRKDKLFQMFLTADLKPLTLSELETLWRSWINPEHLTLCQTRQTWGVEMLMRGMEIDNFGIISGLKSAEIKLFQQRAKEKIAIEQAIALDT